MGVASNGTVMPGTKIAAYYPKAKRTNFFYSFQFLPKEEREAIFTVYAFCRYADDLVDDPEPVVPASVERKRLRIQQLREAVEACYAGEFQNAFFRSLAWVVQRFGIPKQYFLTLLDGIERDLLVHRYETFEELREYCYSVASIVGLIVIEIFGYKYEETKAYAVNLGYALQLTNILRDIKADKERGRIYLPLEDLRRFGYSESELLEEIYNDAFIELMRFEVQRARSYYHKARAMLRSDERRRLVAPQVMDQIYYRLLEKIELNDYNVFQKTIRVSTAHKILIALRLWLKAWLLWK